jgi:hypothetical protein
VVELYTSEGCNSCPRADRWLSRMLADPTTVALAFHVDYWDRLGWQDRFASAEFTRRQAQQLAVNGARFSYTPQVVLQGVDRPDWAGIAVPVQLLAGAAPVAVRLERTAGHYTATLLAARHLAAFWAVTENGHQTVVKAGENDGVTLRHDFVVRELLSVQAWTTTPGSPTTLKFTPAPGGAATPARTVNLVVLDAATGRPVQAVKLGC